MSEVTLFKNMNGNCNVALKSGNVVPFVQAQVGGGPGQFFTTNKKLIQELTAAAQEGEFGVFVDPNEATIDPDAATPLQQMEKRIRAEIMAELENKRIDAGTSHVSAAQAQSAIASTSGGVADGGALSVAQQAAQQNNETVVKAQEGAKEVKEEEKKDETIQPAGSQSPELSALERLKQGQGKL